VSAGNAIRTNRGRVVVRIQKDRGRNDKLSFGVRKRRKKKEKDQERELRRQKLEGGEPELFITRLGQNKQWN